MRAAVLNFWRRWSLRRRQYDGGVEVMDALYDRRDPWNLANEEVRFEATDALIRTHCPDVESLLEIGCGEGLQTRHFLRLARHVTGIDISPQAVARAREAAPTAELLAGEPEHILPTLSHFRHDVATLCEVLYYMPDPARTLALVQSVADHLVVTIYEPRARALEPLFKGQGWREAPPIERGQKRWRAWIWSAE